MILSDAEIKESEPDTRENRSENNCTEGFDKDYETEDSSRIRELIRLRALDRQSRGVKHAYVPVRIYCAGRHDMTAEETFYWSEKTSLVNGRDVSRYIKNCIKCSRKTKIKKRERTRYVNKSASRFPVVSKAEETKETEESGKTRDLPDLSRSLREMNVERETRLWVGN